MTALAAYLAAQRTLWGLSRDDLARRAGLRLRSVEALEERGYLPTPHTLARLAAALDVRPDVLAELARELEPDDGLPSMFDGSARRPWRGLECVGPCELVVMRATIARGLRTG